MKKLFNRAFFKFTAGFVGIVMITVLVILAVGSLEVEREYQTSADVVVDEI